VNVDVLPCGLDHICVSITASQKWWSDQQSGVWVLYWGDQRCTPDSHWQLWYHVGYTP